MQEITFRQLKLNQENFILAREGSTCLPTSQQETVLKNMPDKFPPDKRHTEYMPIVVNLNNT